MITFRRYYIDKLLSDYVFFGRGLDVGGKKDSKRGNFRPPLSEVNSWKYLNIDSSTNPDYCCSAEDTLIGGEEFDIILMIEVLEHLENPMNALKECKRMLKKDGKLIITMPFLNAIHADPYDFQRWTNTALKLKLEKIGLTVESITPMGSLFAVIYDLLYVSLGMASKNKESFRNKVIRKIFMPIFAKLFMLLDDYYSYKSDRITTGYYLEVIK